MTHQPSRRLSRILAIALVGTMGCVAHRHTSSAPCTAQLTPPPPPRADGKVTIYMREMRGRPDQYPMGIVVDGHVRLTLADSSQAARLDSAWGESGFLRLAEVERIDVFRGDSIPARFRRRGLNQIYVFTTCRAREGQ